jgi:hypothetical protein
VLVPDQRAEVTTVVAVLTYRRTEWLPPLLTELAAQAAALVPRADVVVVDNDPAGSAAEVVRGFADRGVRYAHEPAPGISAARNRALDEAAGADVLVFLDDDELPSPGWLTNLTSAWRDWGAAAVVGPVPAQLMGPADRWVAGSGIFDRPRHASGRRMPGAGAGNLLLDLGWVRRLGLRFDERFGLTGGEDTLFTHQLVSGGGEIRWCDEAVAVEYIPVDRLTRAWVLTRTFRAGSSWSRAELHLAGSARRRARLRAVLAAKAVLRSALASLRWLGAAARGDIAGRARSACTLAAYAGLVVGAFGYVHEEYARDAEPAVAASVLPVPVPRDEAERVAAS